MATPSKRTPLGRSRHAELGVIDYTLAKRALLRDAQVGVLGLTDICDAHPELIRAAKHVGEPTSKDCPVCGNYDAVHPSRRATPDEIPAAPSSPPEAP